MATRPPLLLIIVAVASGVREQEDDNMSAKHGATKAHRAPYLAPWFVECYPETKLWKPLSKQAKACMKGITDTDMEALEISQGFCPKERKQQPADESRKVTGYCEKDPNDNRDQRCIYSEKNPNIFDTTWVSLEEGSGPPLYAEASKMRYGDPIYAYSWPTIRYSSPPVVPFINVNLVWRDSKKVGFIEPFNEGIAGPPFEIWAGQCPIEPFVEDEFSLKLKDKKSTICEWLDWIKSERIDTLVSLAPNSMENYGRGTKKNCPDYIGIVLRHLKMVGSEKAFTMCGRPFDVKTTKLHEEEVITGKGTPQEKKYKPHIFKRVVKYDGAEFEQIYFDSWPDAHGSSDPIAATPSIGAFGKILEWAGNAGRVVVHCAGGRGRTGTVIAGLIAQTMKATGTELTASLLAQIVVEMRQFRADMVEDPYQLFMVAKHFGLDDKDLNASDQCQLREDVV